MANDIEKKRAGLRKQVLSNQRPKPSLLRSLKEQSAKVGGYITKGYEQAGIPGAVGGVGRAVSKGVQELAGLSQRAGEAGISGGEEVISDVARGYERGGIPGAVGGAGRAVVRGGKGLVDLSQSAGEEVMEGGGSAVLSGVRAGFTGRPPPAAAPTPEPLPREEAEADIAGTAGGAAIPQTGVRAGVGALPERLASQPGYQEAAQLRETGPAGIRAGTVGKYGAGETPFTQEQFERANTIRKYEAGVEQLTPREMEARGVGPYARPEGVRAASTTAGVAAPTEVREPPMSAMNDIGRRYASLRRQTKSTTVLARLAKQEGDEKAALRESYAGGPAGAPAATTAAAKPVSLRDQIALAKYQGGEKHRAFQRGEVIRGRETSQERHMAGRVDKAVEEMATRLQDGKTIEDPGQAREFRSYYGTSGGAKNEDELTHIKNTFVVGKALQRAHGEAGNPLQSMRNWPVIGGLVRGMDKQGRPMLNEAAVRDVLKTKTTDKQGISTYSIGGRSIKESDLGLKGGMIAAMLSGMLEKR
jgi:hypothetical protein